jgi:arylsulfatase A-like enzyme
LPALVVFLWLGAVHLAAPWLIRLAYSGHGPAALNRIISGQSSHTVDSYLTYWNGLAWRLDLAFVVALVLYLLRRPIAARLRPVLRAEPSIGAGSLLGVSLLWGLTAGVAEGLHIAIAKSLNPLGAATFDQSVEALWMAPLGEAAAFVLVAVGLGVVLRAWKRPVSLRLVTGLALFAVSYGFIRELRLGIGIWPVRLLALGIAVQGSGLIASRAAAFRRRVPVLLMALGVWLLVAGLVLHGGRAARAWWTLRSLPAAEPGSPNVVIVILDTVRAQSLSLYGYDRPTTPRLERLAKESVVFDGAIAPTSWSLPSHAGLVTGRASSGLSTRWDRPLDNTTPTLAEVLAGRGYATGGFIANFYYAGRASGVTRGIAHVEDVPISSRMVRQNAWWARKLQRSAEGRRAGATAVVRDARTVSDGFLRWSAKQEGRPYFALLNFMDAHSPYEAPDSIRIRLGADGVNTLRRGAMYTPAELAEIRASYDAAIAYIDQEIGRVVDSLAARGDLDRTILVVTSDHGEQFGEHAPRLVEHGNSLYGAAVHVPLLIRYPARWSGGARVAGPTAIRRVPATLMVLMDVASGSPFPDPVVDPAAPDTLPVRLLLRPSPSTLPFEPLHAGRIVSVVWRRWHYIRNGNEREELYDLPLDPWERSDRSTAVELADTLARLRALADASLDPLEAPPTGR